MSDNKKNKGLGRGLEAIFEIENLSYPQKPKKSSLMEELPVEAVKPNPNQPRRSFDEEALRELSDSIRYLGVIQPITVKKEGEDNYLIISGERRYRACMMAGLTHIPAYIRQADDQTLLEMALVENIQRQDLNAIDIALSLQQLVDECAITQETLAERVGKKRSTVTNYLRLLKLPAEIQLAVREELISMGHARALISIENAKKQLALLKKTIKNALSVRQVEEMAKHEAEGSKVKKAPAHDEEYPESYTRLVENLERLFSQEISIKKNSRGEGKIVIGFTSDDQIEAMLRTFEKIK